MPPLRAERKLSNQKKDGLSFARAHTCQMKGQVHWSYIATLKAASTEKAKSQCTQAITLEATQE